MSSTQEPNVGESLTICHCCEFQLGPNDPLVLVPAAPRRLDLDALAVEAVQLWLVVERVHVRRPRHYINRKMTLRGLRGELRGGAGASGLTAPAGRAGGGGRLAEKPALSAGRPGPRREPGPGLPQELAAGAAFTECCAVGKSFQISNSRFEVWSSNQISVHFETRSGSAPAGRSTLGPRPASHHLSAAALDQFHRGSTSRSRRRAAVVSRRPWATCLQIIARLPLQPLLFRLLVHEFAVQRPQRLGRLHRHEPHRAGRVGLGGVEAFEDRQAERPLDVHVSNPPGRIFGTARVPPLAGHWLPSQHLLGDWREDLGPYTFRFSVPFNARIESRSSSAVSRRRSNRHIRSFRGSAASALGSLPVAAMRYVLLVMMRRCIAFIDQPRATNSPASQSSSSGCVGASP